MSDIQPQPKSTLGQSPDWLRQDNFDAAMTPSDVLEASQRLEQTSGVGVDPKTIGTVVLPSEVSQTADWPGAVVTESNANPLPSTSGPDWHRG